MAWRHRRGGNPDQNQGDLVALARRLDASVEVASALGNDFPDLVVGFRGMNLLWEIKRPAEVGKTGKRRKAPTLEPGQQDFVNTWRGRVELIRTPEDVVRSLLAADLNRQLDYGTVHDDTLAAVMKILRGRFPDVMNGL